MDTNTILVFMTSEHQIDIQIIKYINYCYLNNYIKNIVERKSNQSTYDWSVFSGYGSDDVNILFFLNSIKKQKNFSEDIILLSINIYIVICEQFAHLIDNYTLLFASIYISVNKIVCAKCLDSIYLVRTLKISNELAKKMVKTIDDFIVRTDKFDSICIL